MKPRNSTQVIQEQLQTRQPQIDREKLDLVAIQHTLIEERHIGIVQIEEKVKEANTILHEILTIANLESDMINSVDENITITATNVQLALEEIKKKEAQMNKSICTIS